MPRVTIIPATINPVTKLPEMSRKKRKVAGYARVSTDKDEQFTSYEAQVDYYTRFIKSHADWDFVKVYTDEGISALGTKNRDGFNEMVEDALAGAIDLIVTKSVSRFARNTVDSLVTIRKLKAKGVEVYFEKENIYSLDNNGELMLTILSSMAQEESRSISENVTWGQRKRFADGKISLPYKQFLGYDRGEKKDDPPVINPGQAAIVRRIYRTFMEGKTAGAIARELTAEGIPTPAGKTNWQASTVSSILQNEKYRGSALLQKHYTVDFLTKSKRSTKERYRNIMWSTVTKRLSTRMSGTPCRRKSGGENKSADPTAASVCSARSSYAGIAAAGTGRRSGTRPTSTRPPFGSAIRNMTANMKNAKRRR